MYVTEYEMNFYTEITRITVYLKVLLQSDFELTLMTVVLWAILNPETHHQRNFTFGRSTSRGVARMCNSQCRGRNGKHLFATNVIPCWYQDRRPNPCRRFRPVISDFRYALNYTLSRLSFA